MSTLQWLAIAAAAGLLIVPRLGGLKDLAGGLLAKVGLGGSADTTDAQRLAAFVVLQPRLADPLAAQLWAAIQPTPAPRPATRAPEAKP